MSVVRLLSSNENPYTLTRLQIWRRKYTPSKPVEGVSSSSKYFGFPSASNPGKNNTTRGVYNVPVVIMLTPQITQSNRSGITRCIWESAPADSRKATSMVRAAEVTLELKSNGVGISFLRLCTVVANVSNSLVFARDTTNVTLAGS